MYDPYKKLFEKGFQDAVVLLRYRGMLGENQFPKLLSKVTAVVKLKRGRGNYAEEVTEFLVKIGIRENNVLKEYWLKFEGRGVSIYVTSDLSKWVRIPRFECT